MQTQNRLWWKLISTRRGRAGAPAPAPAGSLTPVPFTPPRLAAAGGVVDAAPARMMLTTDPVVLAGETTPVLAVAAAVLVMAGVGSPLRPILAARQLPARATQPGPATTLFPTPSHLSRPLPPVTPLTQTLQTKQR